MRAYDHAARVLAVAAAGLGDAGRHVPARVLVAPGADPAWDCEQLTVQVVRPSVQGVPGQEGILGRPVGLPRFVELRVELVRETPPAGATINGEPQPPAADALQACAQELLDDADALRAALTPAAVVGDAGAGRSVYVAPVQLNGPAGGLVSASVLVQLPA